MKAIIDYEFTRYGGDHDHVLYLDMSATETNMHLCLSLGSDAICKHLTSNSKYMDWLYKHHASLLLIPEDKWYESGDYKSSKDLYFEFHYVLNNIDKPVLD